MSNSAEGGKGVHAPPRFSGKWKPPPALRRYRNRAGEWTAPRYGVVARLSSRGRSLTHRLAVEAASSEAGETVVYLRSGTDASRLAMTPAREFPARWASKIDRKRGEGLVMPWAGLASRTSPRNPPQPGDESEGQLTRRLSWVCRPLLAGRVSRACPGWKSSPSV